MPVSQAIDVKQETRTYTVKEIFEALKKNGFQHLRGEWISANAENKPVGACVLGQAALNLGVAADDDYTFNVDSSYRRYNLFDQLNNFEVRSEKWAINGTEAGNAIVEWNDAKAVDGSGNLVKNEDGSSKYVLEEYADVVNMAKEILEPYFEETVELVHFDY